jgi:hypothetical protein
MGATAVVASSTVAVVAWTLAGVAAAAVVAVALAGRRALRQRPLWRISSWTRAAIWLSRMGSTWLPAI